MASSDVVRNDGYMHVTRIHVRACAEAFKYIGNLDRERYDASSYRTSTVAASKPISVQRY